MVMLEQKQINNTNKKGINMNGYDRIKNQYLELSNKTTYANKIVRHLMTQPNMNEHYLNEEKSIEQMMKYINDKAREQAVNNVALILDEDVYKLATNYYTQPNDELGIAVKTKSDTKEVKKETNDQLALGI